LQQFTEKLPTNQIAIKPGAARKGGGATVGGGGRGVFDGIERGPIPRLTIAVAVVG